MAEEEITETTIIEERAEFMVDPATTCQVIQNPTQRTGYFLKPSLNPNALPPQPPKIQSFSSSSKRNVTFLCNSTPLKGWKTWVENLEETHEPEWRKAGIFDAIKGSTYHIGKVRDVIYSLVEKWCPETNTFVFPWGEATVTLEDVYVLGGFSPLGAPVRNSSSSLGENVELVETKLIESFGKLAKIKSNLSQLRWQEHFMGCGNQIEHAGFLALWLARHVFAAKTLSVVTRGVLSMAARLSCGAKLAFGPLILASIYRDLTLLKRNIVGFISGGRSLGLTSPLHLVQVWAWERFPSLAFVPMMINCGEIRLARWVNHVRRSYVDMEMCLDSSKETFRWRPYTMPLLNWSLPRYYVDSGTWVDVDSHEDWKLFSRFVMSGQLIGLNCVERYNPHRVALQFGFDQDIPESVDISKFSYTLDDPEYGMNFKGLKLYLPPRLHVGDVTYRYFDWQRTSINVAEESLVGCKRKKVTENRAKKVAKTCGNVTENSMEKSVLIDEVTSDLLQVCNEVGMACSLNMQCMSISEQDSGMQEANKDEEEGGMELAEMLVERKQDCDAMNNSVCSQVTSAHQNVGNEIGQVMVRCPLITPAGDTGKCEDVSREQNIKERNLIKHDMKMKMKSEYLEANVVHFGTPTECHGNEPDEALCEDNPFAALCLEYEWRISRLERLMVSALSVSNPT